jgi:hypothetical protein
VSYCRSVAASSAAAIFNQYSTAAHALYRVNLIFGTDRCAESHGRMPHARHVFLQIRAIMYLTWLRSKMIPMAAVSLWKWGADRMDMV